MAQLLELGMIVPDDTDETARYLALVEEENKQSTKRFYRILSTTACNARCFYCYENGVAVQSMSDKTARDVADFIADNQGQAKHLLLQFFGGEPLCNTRAIDLISERLTERGLPFEATMTSNGFLINDALARRAKEKWHVHKVQITLDGTKEVYEAVKMYDTPNAFERVIKNIHSLTAVGIRVSIRLNYSEKTKSDIQKLVAFLSEEYKGDENIRVYAHRLFDDDANAGTDEEIYDCLKRHGFLSKRDLDFPELVLNPCMARRRDSLVILPNGDLAKCTRGLNLPNGVIGSIYGAKALSDTWGQLNPDCISCKHLPLCGGGCKCEEFMKQSFCTLSEKEINKKIIEIIKEKETLL